MGYWSETRDASAFGAVRIAAFALLFGLSGAVAAKNTKVELCHIPPGNPGNAQTLSVSESAVPAHLGHGDYLGPCVPAGPTCQEVCEDNNPCTIETCEPGTTICIADPPQLNCDDGDPNTLDACDAAQGGCINTPLVMADPQTVTTTGAVQITLTGSAPAGSSLDFSIVTPPVQGTLGAITPVVPAPLSLCSLTTTQSCVTDGDCPIGETCDVTQPPTLSALVTYSPTSGTPADDAFEFAASLATNPTVSDTAIVTINPVDPSTPPDNPVATVEAFDTSAETLADQAITVMLLGEAPCELADGEANPCDGLGEDVSLSFATTTSPTNGVLSNLTQGSAVPQRSATVDYTPNAGFTGADSFSFEACGEIASVLTCASATATVSVAAGIGDQNVETQQNVPVTIDLGLTQAALVIGAGVAGAVADSNGDNFGDNANVLPGSAPLLASAAVDSSGGPGSNGTVRFLMKWDISSLTSPGDVQSAEVVIHTLKGSVDLLDTNFYSVSVSPPGEIGFQLLASEYGTPATGGILATMPVPAGAIGTEGTFSFDVLSPLQAAITSGATVFGIRAQVDESLSGGGSKRGLQMRTTANGNLSALKEPKLSVTTAGTVGGPVITITAFPLHGTLIDGNGAPVPPSGLVPGSKVVYVPNPTYFGPDSFSYTLDDGVNLDAATINIQVTGEPCETVGRDAGCAPGVAI